MADIGNGTYKVAVLADGREIKIDMELVRNGHRKVRQLRDVSQLVPLSDDHLAWLSRYTGLTADELLDLDTEDFKKIDTVMGGAMKELSGPN